MEIIKTDFTGLVVIHPEVHLDNRGYFFESFNKSALERQGIIFNPVQDNESKSSRGVVRGLHYQLEPVSQAKLIRVVEGKIYDVALDLRRNSATFGKWFGIILDSETRQQVLIPRGFAHGFSVLSDLAVIQYKCDNPYSREQERGISIKDPALGIDWQLEENELIISSKDQNQPLLKDAEFNF